MHGHGQLLAGTWMFQRMTYLHASRHARLSALLSWDRRPFRHFASTIKLAINLEANSPPRKQSISSPNHNSQSQWPTQSPSLSPINRTLRRRKRTENGPAGTTTSSTRAGCHGWKINISSGSAKTTKPRTPPKVWIIPACFLSSNIGPSKC